MVVYTSVERYEENVSKASGGYTPDDPLIVYITKTYDAENLDSHIRNVGRYVDIRSDLPNDVYFTGFSTNNLFERNYYIVSFDMSLFRYNLTTNTIGMFKECVYLKTIKFDQYKLLDAEGMFRGCTRLTKIEKLPTIENASYMFYGCTLLTEVPKIYAGKLNYTLAFTGVKKYDATILTQSSKGVTLWQSAENMFEGSKIESIIYSVPNCYDTAEMFKDCTQLKSISIGDNTVLRKCYGMFEGCTALEELALWKLDYARLVSAYNIINNTPNLKCVKVDFNALEIVEDLKERKEIIKVLSVSSSLPSGWTYSDFSNVEDLAIVTNDIADAQPYLDNMPKLSSLSCNCISNFEFESRTLDLSENLELGYSVFEEIDGKISLVSGWKITSNTLVELTLNENQVANLESNTDIIGYPIQNCTKLSKINIKTSSVPHMLGEETHYSKIHFENDVFYKGKKLEEMGGGGSSDCVKIDGSNATATGVSTMINKLTEGTSDPVDNDYYVAQYANGGTTTTTYHRRPVKALWNYIKGKMRLLSGDKDNETHDCNSALTNGFYYYTSNGPATSIGASATDGSLYVQRYNDTWISQIAQDYRNGNIFVRAKNNGTWTSWVRVAKAGEIPTSLPANGGTAQYSNVLNAWTKTRQSAGNISPKDANEYGTIKWHIASSSMTDAGHTLGDGFLVTFFWDNSGRYDSQLFIPNGSTVNIAVRYYENKAWTAWKKLAYSSDIPTSLPANGGTANYATYLGSSSANYSKSSLDTAISNAKNLANATGTLAVTHGGTGKTSLNDVRVGSADIAYKIRTSRPSTETTGDIWME